MNSKLTKLPVCNRHADNRRFAYCVKTTHWIPRKTTVSGVAIHPLNLKEQVVTRINEGDVNTTRRARPHSFSCTFRKPCGLGRQFSIICPLARKSLKLIPLIAAVLHGAPSSFCFCKKLPDPTRQRAATLRRRARFWISVRVCTMCTAGTECGSHARGPVPRCSTTE